MPKTLSFVENRHNWKKNKQSPLHKTGNVTQKLNDRRYTCGDIYKGNDK